MQKQAKFESCYTQWDDDSLTIGNAFIQRRWQIRGGQLYAQSMLDRVTGAEWLAKPSRLPFASPHRPLPDEARSIQISAERTQSVPTAAPALQVTIVARGDSATLTTQLTIYPDAAAVTTQLSVNWANATAEDTFIEENTEESAPTGVELSDMRRASGFFPSLDLLDYFDAAPIHLRLRQVILRDQTDIHNQLVQENEWLIQPNERQRALDGNLFILENTLTGNGLILLKQSPLPGVRPLESPFNDLRFDGSNASSPEGDAAPQPLAVSFGLYGHGIDGAGEGYPWTILTCQNGAAGVTRALHQFQRQVRQYQPDRDGLFLSNTWGDRSRDAAITAEFMSAEVEAGSKLGVDVIQIDDGWEQGTTSNSVNAQAMGGVWEGFHGKDHAFWAVNRQRFPDGLEPIIAKANEHGMQFGLWFGPDSADDFANWKLDADTLLRLYQSLSVRYFKLDGIKARTRRGEKNLRQFFRRVLTESDGNIVLDLDVTAEVRPGYFGAMDGGPLFVENRYTDHHKYWPHHTLRNLWQLARYIDPVRLRMEVLNNARNANRYQNDPLAPGEYRPDYLFATVMFASPLGWFEISNLPQSYFESMGKLAAIWKQHRAGIFSGQIWPIGSAPDGVSWTGFLSLSKDNSAGYILVFRELNGESQQSIALPAKPASDYIIHRLAGDGSAIQTDGILEIEIPQSQQFFFGQFG